MNWIHNNLESHEVSWYQVKFASFHTWTFQTLPLILLLPFVGFWEASISCCHIPGQPRPLICHDPPSLQNFLQFKAAIAGESPPQRQEIHLQQTGARGSRQPLTPQERRATSCAGKSGQHLCASELEGRKRGENAKHSTQVLFLAALHALICDESYGSTGWSSTGLLKQMQEHISC